MAMKSSLTILFENPFWIGLFERIDSDKYEVCKMTFGRADELVGNLTAHRLCLSER